MANRAPPLGSLLLKGRRIGLLGGSFNPAHAGHLHISREALRRLGLDEVWWLVSPQNPLKPTTGMADFAERVKMARQVAKAEHRILVSDLEVQLGTRYTADTLHLMRKFYPLTKFVWLMGADNLQQITAWARWPSIFTVMPVAVFARKSYDIKALSGMAVHRFGFARRPAEQAHRLASQPPPAWVFVLCRHHPASATAIRHSRLGIDTGVSIPRS